MTRPQTFFPGGADSAREPRRSPVLVVDDDDAIRDALCQLLDDAGFATVGARHGREALEILSDLRPAPTFILLDLMMPVMDGWAFCDHRERHPALREIPVIALSAAEIADWDLPVGIDAFLSKPIDLDALTGLVRRRASARRAAWASRSASKDRLSRPESLRTESRSQTR